MPFHSLASALVQVARRWRPGVGDPTLLGWLTVAGYLVAFALCWRAHEVGRARPGRVRASHAWAVLAACMLLLGLNKQLDLQMLLEQLGKAAAFAGGWYAERHVVQLWFVFSLAAACTITGLFAYSRLRAHAQELWLAAVGSALLVGYMLTRAAFFEHVNWDGHSGGAVAGFHFVLELAGIACVATGARRSARAPG
jgi:hypothetical protein